MKEFSSRRFIAAQDKTDTLEGRGKVTNHPEDRGGLTKTGLTQGVYDLARARWGKDSQPVTEATEEERLQIFWEDYWAPMKCEDFEHESTAFALYQFGVNCGIYAAPKACQEAMGMSPMDADGVVGPKTIKSLDCEGEAGGPELIFKAQVKRYQEIVKSSNLKVRMWHADGKAAGAPRPKDQRANALGWINRVDNAAKMAKHPYRVPAEIRSWALLMSGEYKVGKLPS